MFVLVCKLEPLKSEKPSVFSFQPNLKCINRYTICVVCTYCISFIPLCVDEHLSNSQLLNLEFLHMPFLLLMSMNVKKLVGALAHRLVSKRIVLLCSSRPAIWSPEVRV